MPTTILIVDRDPQRRSLIAKHFAESSGIRVVGSGEDVGALRSIKVEPPTLILIAVQEWQEETPWMLLALRAIAPAMPIIAYSDCYDNEATRKASASGLLELLPAAATRERFLIAVTNALRPVREGRVA
jgi:DNA-binding NarL/FixJ family response regulator